MKTRDFGYNSKGQKATLYTLENSLGTILEVSDFGATLYRLVVNGKDVVLAYDSASDYEGPGGTFFGSTVGRNANRIANGHFVLNGKAYQLTINNGPNNLHSGLDFWSFRVWNVKEVSDNSVTFALHSPHMDQGYPGEVDVEVKYTLTEDNEVRIDYHGTTSEDTILNLTNHAYFNLNGHDSGDILKHQVWIDADAYTRNNINSVPTGEILDVTNTPMDFRTLKEVGRDINEDYEALNFGKGYDHNWCLKNDGQLALVASLIGDQTGIEMEVYTDLPGVQIYTANYVNNQHGKGGAIYNERHGICFETQYYPDAINHPNFKQPITKADEVYQTTTIYKFK